MDVEQIRALRLARPFKEFVLVMNDGRRFTIDKPYYLAISPLKNVILVATEGSSMELFKPESVKEAMVIEGAAERRDEPRSRESA